MSQEPGLEMLTLRLQQCESSLPTLPSIAIRVIELASDPDAHVAQLARVITKDQVLATRVLALANSGYGAPNQQVISLTQAMIRLGTERVRNLVLAVSFYSRMCDQRVYGPYGRTLMDHSLGTAYLARLVAETACVDVDEAFLCGLVHDIGKLVIYKAAHECQCPLDGPEMTAFVAERHPVVGANALRGWGLTESLEQPVLHHHDYQAARTGRRQTAVIYLANCLSHRYGFGCDKREYDPLSDPVCAELNLGEQWLVDTDGHAPGLYEIAKQTFA